MTGNMFSCVPFGIQGWIAVVLLAVTMIPVDLVRKLAIGKEGRQQICMSGSGVMFKHTSWNLAYFFGGSMAIFFTDLDNTLIYSYRRDIGRDKVCVELYQGREISFVTA